MVSHAAAIAIELAPHKSHEFGDGALKVFITTDRPLKEERAHRIDRRRLSLLGHRLDVDWNRDVHIETIFRSAPWLAGSAIVRSIRLSSRRRCGRTIATF